MSIIQGTVVADAIVPLGSNATHYDTFGQGGFRSVQTLAERDAIAVGTNLDSDGLSSGLRKADMLVAVVETGKLYQLHKDSFLALSAADKVVALADNAHWMAFASSDVNKAYVDAADQSLRVAIDAKEGIYKHSTGPDSIVPNNGRGNLAPGFVATIAGGQSNYSTGSFSAIVGGVQNQSGGDSAFVGAGYANTAPGAYAMIGGGSGNEASGSNSFVGGGQQNKSYTANSVIAGGQYNYNNGLNSTIGGGDSNYARNQWVTIAGGAGNNANAFQSTVGGGYGNLNNGNTGTIAGGSANGIDTAGEWGFIGGGGGNGVQGQYGTVGGGYHNFAGAFACVMGGNTNQASGAYGSVLGGNANIASGNYSSIFGGASNVVSGEYGSTDGRNNIISGLDNHAYGCVNCAIPAGTQNITLVNCQNFTAPSVNNRTYFNNSLYVSGNVTQPFLTSNTTVATTEFVRRATADFYYPFFVIKASVNGAAAVVDTSPTTFTEAIASGNAGGPGTVIYCTRPTAQVNLTILNNGVILDMMGHSLSLGHTAMRLQHNARIRNCSLIYNGRIAPDFNIPGGNTIYIQAKVMAARINFVIDTQATVVFDGTQIVNFGQRDVAGTTGGAATSPEGGNVRLTNGAGYPDPTYQPDPIAVIVREATLVNGLMTSPNGTKYRLTVDNAGALAAMPITIS